MTTAPASDGNARQPVSKPTSFSLGQRVVIGTGVLLEAYAIFHGAQVSAAGHQAEKDAHDVPSYSIAVDTAQKGSNDILFGTICMGITATATVGMTGLHAGRREGIDPGKYQGHGL